MLAVEPFPILPEESSARGALRGVLNTTDLHLIPQRAEAADLVLPSKLGGILASGRPVVAMAAPATGLADEIEGAGLLAAPGNAHALAEAVRALAENGELRYSLGAKARRCATERWDQVAILEALEREFMAFAARWTLRLQSPSALL